MPLRKILGQANINYPTHKQIVTENEKYFIRSKK